MYVFLLASKKLFDFIMKAFEFDAQDKELFRDIIFTVLL